MPRYVARGSPTSSMPAPARAQRREILILGLAYKKNVDDTAKARRSS